MAANYKKIDPIYKKYSSKVISTLASTEFYEYFMNVMRAGKNTVQFSNRRVEKMVDERWVLAIEAAIKPMQEIINNPRNFIMSEEIISNIALVKKVEPDSIRHLAMHGNMIDEVTEDSVRPNKMMEKTKEDSWNTYENKFVYTLIGMAWEFVDKRYEAIFASMNEEFGAHLIMSSDAKSYQEHITANIELRIQQEEDLLSSDKKNESIFSRIARLHRILGTFKSSAFAKAMDKFGTIKPPLVRTNAIAKNPNFKACHKLWNFILSYQDVGYKIDIFEQSDEISESFSTDIIHSIMFDYIILKNYLESKEDRVIDTSRSFKKKALKPKYIHEIVEEIVKNYDLPDVEIRKVLIEEITKAQLMQEEEKERQRLVEEKEKEMREREKKQKQEQARKAREEERERLRKIKEEEKEAARREKERLAEEARQKKLQERLAEEEKARSQRIRAELDQMAASRQAMLKLRADRAAAEQKRLAEEAAAEEQRRIEAEKRRIAEEKARREKELAEEKERLRIAKEKEKEEKAKAIAAEKARIAAEKEKAKIAAEKAKEKEKAKAAAEKEKARIAAEKAKEKEKAKAAAEKEKTRIAAEKAKEKEKAKAKAEAEKAKAKAKAEAEKAKAKEKAEAEKAKTKAGAKSGTGNKTVKEKTEAEKPVNEEQPSVVMTDIPETVPEEAVSAAPVEAPVKDEAAPEIDIAALLAQDQPEEPVPAEDLPEEPEPAEEQPEEPVPAENLPEEPEPAEPKQEAPAPKERRSLKKLFNSVFGRNSK